MSKSHGAEAATHFRGNLYTRGIYTQGSAGMTPAGKVFFVNTNAGASARNVGREWYDVDGRMVFSTVQAAIDACVASRGDIIFMARGYDTVTETVNFNKTGITFVVQTFGGPRASMGEYTAIIADDTFTDGPVATITAPCTIDGLGFASKDAGTLFYSGAACLIGGLASAAPYGVHMVNCRFPKWGWTNRIGLAIEGSSDCLIENCQFEGVTQDFAAGIYMQGATANLEIKDCKFTDCDYAMVFGTITGGGPGPDLDFHGNRVIGADSKGINTNAQTGRGIIWNNYFNTDQGTSTFDRTTDQLDTQGFQLMGNYYKDESTGPT